MPYITSDISPDVRPALKHGIVQSSLPTNTREIILTARTTHPCSHFTLPVIFPDDRFDVEMVYVETDLFRADGDQHFTRAFELTITFILQQCFFDLTPGFILLIVR